jgi:hypothetical protein
MLLTQSLTPTQLKVGCGVGTGRVTVLEIGFLVFDEGPLLVLGEDCMVVDGLLLVMKDNLVVVVVVVVERGFVMVVEGSFVIVVEGDFVMVMEGDFVLVDKGVVEGGVDPPVIRFLMPRS